MLMKCGYESSLCHFGELWYCTGHRKADHILHKKEWQGVGCIPHIVLLPFKITSFMLYVYSNGNEGLR